MSSGRGMSKTNTQTHTHAYLCRAKIAHKNSEKLHTNVFVVADGLLTIVSHTQT